MFQSNHRGRPLIRPKKPTSLRCLFRMRLLCQLDRRALYFHSNRH